MVGWLRVLIPMDFEAVRVEGMLGDVGREVVVSSVIDLERLEAVEAGEQPGQEHQNNQAGLTHFRYNTQWGSGSDG